MSPGDYLSPVTSIRRLIPTLAVLGLLLFGAVGTGGAVGVDDRIDECTNADEGPGENGPPGFVAELVPNFQSDLVETLPVPNFVKGFFGAQTC